MTLRDVQSVHAPDVTKIDIVGHVKLKEMLNVGRGAFSAGGSQIGLLMPNGTFYTFTGSPKRPDESQEVYEARRDTEIQTTYDALKGPTDGSSHPMAAGRVIVRDANGSEVGPPPGLLINYQNTVSKWNAYLESIASSTVETVPIFSIDLNQFTSGYNRVKILTYGERISREP